MNTYFIPDIYSYTGYREVRYNSRTLDFYCFDCGFACETKEEAVRLCKAIEEFCRRRKNEKDTYTF